MKKQLLIVALAGFASLSLVACGGAQSSGKQGNPVSSSSGGVAAAAAPATAAAAARATLTVMPGSVSSCAKDAHINPEVSWQRIDATIMSTKVTVSAPGSSEEKLFAAGGFGGSAKAGDWVVPGVTFRLYDAGSGTLLASYTVRAVPCAN